MAPCTPEAQACAVNTLLGLASPAAEQCGAHKWGADEPGAHRLGVVIGSCAAILQAALNAVTISPSGPPSGTARRDAGG